MVILFSNYVHQDNWTSLRFLKVVIKMDVDLHNITRNSSEVYVSKFLDTFYFMEMCTAIVALVSSVANALIFLTIFLHSKLHTHLYFYIANWCICNCLVTSMIPFRSHLFGYDAIMELPASFLCLIDENELVFMVGDLLFVSALLADWFLMTFHGQSYASRRCRHSYRIIVAVCWIFLLSIFTSTTIMCVRNNYFTLSSVESFVSYLCAFSLFPFVCFLRIYYLRTSSVLIEKRTLEFYLVLSYYLCWLPNILYCLVLICTNSNYLNYYTTIHLTYMVGISNACIVLGLMFYFDKTFKSCFLKLYFCKSNVGSVPEEHISYEPSSTILIATY